MISAEFDHDTANAFADRLMTIINHGSLALMISVGHRTGLFDAMADMGWATAEEIARRAHRNTRYVREWLGAMVTGQVVAYEPRSRTYRLRPEHASFLTRDAAPNNIAAFTQYIALLGGVEDKIVECFEKGGGVPYSEFPRFHEVMAEDSGQSVVPMITKAILPLAPGLMERLERGIDVLDVGCGVGRALNVMAARFPKSRFRGYDFSPEAIEAARRESAGRGHTNIVFEVRDVAALGETDAYDLITAFDAVHDQVHPDRVLRAIQTALRPDGVFLMQDIKGSSHLEKNLEHPAGPFLYTVSCMHCMTVSLAENGAGLGTMWGREKALEMLGAAGFTDVRIHELSHDFQNVYYVVRKS